MMDLSGPIPVTYESLLILGAIICLCIALLIFGAYVRKTEEDEEPDPKIKP